MFDSIFFFVAFETTSKLLELFEPQAHKYTRNILPFLEEHFKAVLVCKEIILVLFFFFFFFWASLHLALEYQAAPERMRL
jgi:hypothetical protein